MNRFFLFFTLILTATIYAFAVSPAPVYLEANAPLQQSDQEYFYHARNVPQWNWKTAPQTLLENYYDYFQCYNDTPVAVRNDDNGGIFIIYRAYDSNGQSLLYYSYINADGEIEITENFDFQGRYPDAHIDELTGDIFVSWHGDVSREIGSFALYDLYHIAGEYCNWKDDPILVIDPANAINIFPHPEDYFVYPQIKTGPSPDPDRQRVYLLASNITLSHGATSLPSENYLICYADFDADDLALQSNLEWEYTSIPQLDAFNQEDPDWARPIKSWTVIDNKLIVLGYLQSEEDDRLFCLINENYGTGVWQEYYQHWFFEEENPQFYLPGNPNPQYLFSDNPVFQGIINSHNFNLVTGDNNQKVYFSAAMGVIISDQHYFYPDMFMIYPKMLGFDLNTCEFTLSDVYPVSANPSDDLPLRPWDLDEDGEIDQFEDTGYPLWFKGYPVMFPDPASMFHYNHYTLASNPLEGWIACIWVDGQKLTGAEHGLSGYDGWEDTPEIMISFSENNGESWFDPIILNANPASENYCPELENMTPGYLYPADFIQSIDDNAVIHLFFIDDYEFGSHYLGDGDNSGAAFKYAAINIEPSDGKDENQLTPLANYSRNYPNPFNPQTTIEFTLKSTNHLKIEIYNVKGQKVHLLTDALLGEGTHQIVWQADNFPSGLYFYRITCNEFSLTKKMILMK